MKKNGNFENRMVPKGCMLWLRKNKKQMNLSIYPRYSKNTDQQMTKLLNFGMSYDERVLIALWFSYSAKKF